MLTAPIHSTGRRPILSERRPVSGMQSDMATNTGTVSSVPWISS